MPQKSKDTPRSTSRHWRLEVGWGERDEPEKKPRPRPSERELRMERALRLARTILKGEAQMTADAVTVIDNALEP